MRLVLTAVMLILLACTDEDATRESLSEQGYTSITVGGHIWRGCHQDDSSCTEFWAMAPNGANVHGAMGCTRPIGGCGGKTCTMRIFAP